MPIIPQENFTSFDEAIRFVRANPNRYVIKPSGEAQNIKRLLFVGEEEDGRDVIQVLEDYQRHLSATVKEFQLQRRIVGEVREALQPLGYYEPEVTFEVDQQDTDWRVTIHVRPGRPVRLSEVHIDVVGAGSEIGDWAYATAIVVWAYLDGGAVAVGAYQAVRFVVMAVAAPIAIRKGRRDWLQLTYGARATLAGWYTRKSTTPTQ